MNPNEDFEVEDEEWLKAHLHRVEGMLRSLNELEERLAECDTKK